MTPTTSASTAPRGSDTYVVIPSAMGAWLMRQRNLLRMAVTRAKRIVALDGRDAALAKVVRTQGAGDDTPSSLSCGGAGLRRGHGAQAKTWSWAKSERQGAQEKTSASSKQRASAARRHCSRKVVINRRR